MLHFPFKVDGFKLSQGCFACAPVLGRFDPIDNLESVEFSVKVSETNGYLKIFKWLLDVDMRFTRRRDRNRTSKDPLMVEGSRIFNLY